MTGQEILQSIVNGTIAGAIYGLVAVGLVLVYKGTRVFNFAQGEFGTVAAFVAWLLATGPELPLPLALLAGIAAAVAFGLVVERLVVRPLLSAPRVILLVATAGIAIGTIALQLILGEEQGRILPPLGSPQPLFIFGVGVFPQQLIIVGVLVVVAVAMYLFFSKTDLGVAILAMSQDPLATRLVGIPLQRVSALVWGLAALLGGIAGVLQGAVVLFTPGFMTTGVLLAAFTGAVLGGMTSLPGAFLGGVLVGLAESLGNGFIPETIPGGGELTVFAVLLLILLIRPQGLLGTEA